MDNQASISNQTEIPVANLPKNLTQQSKRKPLLIAAILILLLIVAVIAFFLFKSRSDNSKIDKLSGEAYLATQRGDYKTARDKVRDALKIKKNDPELLAQMINAYSLDGNQTGKEEDIFHESEAYVDQAIELDTNNVNLLLAIGYAYEAQGNYDKAYEYFLEATKVDPKSSDAWFHLGHVLEFLGKRQEAYSNYDKSYALNPNNPLVLMVRGNMLLAQGKLQESYESFKKASGVPRISNQIKAEALTGASLVRSSQDNFRYIDEATQLSKKAVEADPNFSPALAAYGFNTYLTSDKTKGIEYLEKSIRANPRISKNYMLLSIANRGTKNYMNAIDLNKQAISKIGDDNTVFSTSDKNAVKAGYIYELAKTYSVSEAYPPGEILALLKQAVELRPSVKQELETDLIYGGLFKELYSNHDFALFLQSR